MVLTATVDGTAFQVEVRPRAGGYLVVLAGRLLALDHAPLGDHFASLLVDGHSHEFGFEKVPEGFRIHLADGAFTVGIGDSAGGPASASQHAAGPQRISSPMPGRVVQVLVQPGDLVQAGQSLVVIEAMKMENELRTPRAGQVREIVVREGEAVEAGALVAVVL
jgi:acetyl/propionyl-CoA carboxylase alpha subunit